MFIICESCELKYDDTYRLACCPHEPFEMRTVVGDPNGIVGVAMTLDEYEKMVKRAQSAERSYSYTPASVDAMRRKAGQHLTDTGHDVRLGNGTALCYTCGWNYYALLV